MDKMIEVKSVYENGEFFGTIQTDDGTVSYAKRYTNMVDFADDLRKAYNELFGNHTTIALSLEGKSEADNGTKEVEKTSEKAAK